MRHSQVMPRVNAFRHVPVSEQTICLWTKQYGGSMPERINDHHDLVAERLIAGRIYGFGQMLDWRIDRDRISTRLDYLKMKKLFLLNAS